MPKRKKNKYFDDKFLDEVESKLKKEEQELEAMLNNIAVKNPHNPDDWDAKFEDLGDDETENANEVAEYSVNKSKEVTLEKQLRDVKVSLTRIQDGTYGICKYTGQPIDKKRLLARPTSSTSVDVKNAIKNS